MTAEIKSLSSARAAKTNDCFDWTPLDALKDLVKGIEDGKINPSNLVVHYFEADKDGGRRHHYQAAGLTFPDHIALLHVAMDRALREWHK